MDNWDALRLIKNKNRQITLDEAIELIEKKIKWCNDVLSDKDDGLYGRVYVEATTLQEALDIVKRIDAPHDAPIYLFSQRKQIAEEFKIWAKQHNAQECYENFMAYLEIRGIIKR